MLKHAEKSYQLRGVLQDVRDELKAGWSEEIYHLALASKLEEQGIQFLSKPRRSLIHRGLAVHLFEPDFIVWNIIIVDLKVLPYDRQFPGEHFAQIIHYLKFWRIDLGMLVNMAHSPLIIKRVLWEESPLEIIEEYSKIQPMIQEINRPDLRQIRQTILTIGKEYGLGYPESVYRSLLAIEFRHFQVPCISDVAIHPQITDRITKEQQTPLLLIADRYLLHVRSLITYPTEYDFARMKTYLSVLGLSIGILVNFGKKQLQIYGVNSS